MDGWDQPYWVKDAVCLDYHVWDLLGDSDLLRYARITWYPGEVQMYRVSVYFKAEGFSVYPRRQFSVLSDAQDLAETILKLNPDEARVLLDRLDEVRAMENIYVEIKGGKAIFVRETRIRLSPAASDFLETIEHKVLGNRYTVTYDEETKTYPNRDVLLELVACNILEIIDNQPDLLYISFRLKYSTVFTAC